MPNRKERYVDMEKYKKTRSKQREKYYNKTAYIYPGRPWTEEEEAAVLAHEITDTELSNKIQRSVNAIQTKRSYLKKSMRKE